ncbi:MAG: hypothetical protein K0S86_2794 [Geminicoccaceae bacterium]|jgi:hypothetical protein|nr:hypothetical protein [Geminicoccaceae bacterium]
MARQVKVVGTVSAVAVAAGVAAVATGGTTWRRATAREQARLQATARVKLGPLPDERARAGLPAPVARYFALALPEGLTPVRGAHIRWAGEFQMRPGAGWRPFEAEQDFTTSPPGFVWDARIQMMPLVRVHVRDGYVAGEGAMLGKVGGLITVVDEGGTPEMASSALIRWLGEALWFPTALLPTGPNGEGVRWDAVNESTARATMTDGGTAVSAEFHFAPTGEITRMTAMRYRDVNGTGVLTPFEGQYRTYGRHDGVLIPMAAEVAWLLPEGRFPYWRGRPVAVRYDRDVSP